jgi:hypothetical protein
VIFRTIGVAGQTQNKISRFAAIMAATVLHNNKYTIDLFMHKGILIRGVE